MAVYENKIDTFKNKLYDKRIKFGVDYAYTYKYGTFRVLCDALWEYEIREVAHECGLMINAVTTYETT